tara:strand:- start:5068 stop:5769 length:702 start_codon:yes stop_codon:yes gene_type:complete
MKIFTSVGWTVFAFAAGGLAGYLATWLVDYTVIRDAFCQPNEVHCAREWIAATSGWIAAIVATCTILVLLNQTKLLKAQTGALISQTDDLRKQTEAALGDALPVISAYFSNPREKDVLITISNINRHRIEIEGIRASSESEIAIGRVDDWQADRGDSGCRIFRPPNTERIVGHTNRNAAPPEKQMHAHDLTVKEGLGTKPTYDLVVEVEIKVCGPTHTRHTLTSRVSRPLSGQ